MAELPSPDGHSTFCIDKTEVTQRDYEEFLKSTGDKVASTRAECAWNTTYRPPAIDATEPEGPCALAKYGFDPKAHPLLPVGCVDFCDAVAYCEWAGKRLCGKIGGGAVSSEELDNPSFSQWYSACSMGKGAAYPYGDTYQEGICRTGGPDSTGTVAPVGTRPSCRGAAPPYDEVLDLIGNADEWEDNCYVFEGGDGKKRVLCVPRGGGVESMQSAQTCASSGSTSIGARSPGTGIRCCLD